MEANNNKKAEEHRKVFQFAYDMNEALYEAYLFSVSVQTIGIALAIHTVETVTEKAIDGVANHKRNRKVKKLNKAYAKHDCNEPFDIEEFEELV